ncbi:MAG: thermonuclease family protein [Symploca sp. SIO2C1]|nr:thermonuclease family protein [Symploca sp. SIO2C1]
MVFTKASSKYKLLPVLPHLPKLLWRCCLLCCCLLLLVGCQSHTEPEGITLQVQRVVSGQTLEVLDTTKQPALIERVRLIGIDAPDLRQAPWGAAAKQSLEQMIGELNGQQLILQPVLLEPDVQKKDNFGRWLAYVWHNGVLLNQRLIEEGHVLAVPRSPNNKYDAEFAYAQEYARIMGYGIWNPEEPMRLTPKEFRKNPY